MAEIWGAVAVAAVSAGTAIYSTQQQKKAANKALEAQRGVAEDLKYTPIDIEQLKADTSKAAVENATASLAMERSLQPDVANTRAELSRQISADLALGGELPTDLVNRVNTAGRTLGARSGIGSGSTVPLTASLLGLSSIDLLNQRRAQAENLLRSNPLPVAGLDPGQIASLEIANNNAQNQFDLAKSGVNSNLIQSEADARASQIAGQAGIASSLTSLMGTMAGAYGTPSTSTNYANTISKVPKTNTSYYNQNPASNPLMSSSPLGLS
jgi:hypothetical protein